MPERSESVAEQGDARRLQKFCAAVLGILQSEADSPPPSLCGELTRVLGEGVCGLAEELRRELRQWDAALEQLDVLAESRYFDSAPSASALRAELQQKRAVAARVVAVLDALRPEPGAEQASTPPQPEDLVSPLAEPEPAEGEEPAPEPGLEDADHTRLCFERAEAHRRARELDRAAALYGLALRFDPRCRPAYVRRGLVLLLQGRNDAAVADLTAALALAPADAEAYGLRGGAHAQAGRLDEAVADLTQALRLRPDLVGIRYHLAVAYRLRGEAAKALAELNCVLHARPDHAAAYYQRGLAHAQEGRQTEAVADFTAALRHNPNLAEARRQLQEATAAPQAAAPVPAPEPAPKPAPKPQQNPGTGARRMTVNCPCCGVEGAVNWDRLDKVMVCSGCRASFAVRPDGVAAVVVRGGDGRWIEAAKRTLALKKARARWRNGAALAAAAVVLVAVAASAWWITHPSAAAEAELPRELTPRAELFARAWLRNDVPLMRRLTTPTHDRILYSWYTRHRPPLALAPGQALPEGLKVEVNPVAGSGRVSVVHAQVSGLPQAAGRPALDLSLSWEERGGTWYFVPPAR